MWSPWLPCDADCGGGIQERNRFCNNPTPEIGGKDCTILGSDKQTRLCNLFPCSVNNFQWPAYASIWNSCTYFRLNLRRVSRNKTSHCSLYLHRPTHGTMPSRKMRAHRPSKVPLLVKTKATIILIHRHHHHHSRQADYNRYIIHAA